MDELSVVLKARDLVNKVKPAAIPVPIKSYLDHANAVLRLEHDLDPDEPGWSFASTAKYFICINAKDRKERQRFTACHELAHIVLGLPSEHKGMPSWSYAERSPNEILCDVFASELLIPYKLFKPLVEKSETSLATVDVLAERFDASTIATGSRFAALISAPCAFVLSEQGRVRYAARSTALREADAWIRLRLWLPQGSVSERLRAGGAADGPEEVPADVWFDDWDRGGTLLEDARHLERWDQTVALIWFEDEEVPPPRQDRGQREEQEFGLAELDGVLPWPGRKRRRCRDPRRFPGREPFITSDSWQRTS
jgi:Zn-dependent peptidase ImmA (M78 family)